MGKSGKRKRAKKAERAKREKARKAQAAEQATIADSGDAGEAAGPGLTAESQSIVIELQRTELSRLLREQQRLNERIDQLMRLHEREQVLRQQMQAALDRLAAQRALPPAQGGDAERARLVERVDRAESKFARLQSAVGLLVGALERQTVAAHSRS